MSEDPATTEMLAQARNNARLRAEIALHQSQLRLSESFGGGFSPFPDLVNPMSQYFDGLMPIFPLSPSRFDRRIGSNGIWISEAQMDLIRLYARYLFDTSLTAQGVIRGKSNYIFGTGFKYTVQGKPDERVAEKLQEQAQRILDDFMEANQWHLRETERYKRVMRDGESVLRITPGHDDDDCCATLRTVEPEQIRAPNTDPDWLLGVHTDAEDRERVLGYGITYTGNLDDVEEIPAEEISFLKIGTDMAVPRGLTCFFTSQQVITGLQKLLQAGIEGESVRQAIAYIVEHQLADKPTVTGMVAETTDWNTPVTGNVPGKTVPTEHVVPGSVHEMPAARQVKPPPISDTSNATNMLAAGYQALSVFFQVPQWMASGDTGNTNFAASLTAESPLVKDTEVEQQFHAKENIALFKKVLRIAESQGRLPEGTVRRLAIYAECPSPAVRDAQKETEQNATLNEKGVLSLRTWSVREDLDYDEERANIQDEPKPVVAKTATTAASTTPAAAYSSQTGGGK